MVLDDRDKWEALDALWPLVCAEINERIATQRALLESSGTTTTIERIREIQGEIKGLKSAAGIVPQKLREGGKHRERRV